MSGRGRATLWVFGGILLGRIIGYGRELSISSTFGLSGMGDVVQAGLTIPDFMFNLLVGGAVGGALIPEFTRRSPEERNGLHRTASIWLGSVLMVVALLASIWPAPLATLVASGFKALEKTELLIQLSASEGPCICCSCDRSCGGDASLFARPPKVRLSERECVHLQPRPGGGGSTHGSRGPARGDCHRGLRWCPCGMVGSTCRIKDRTGSRSRARAA